MKMPSTRAGEHTGQSSEERLRSRQNVGTTRKENGFKAMGLSENLCGEVQRDPRPGPGERKRSLQRDGSTPASEAGGKPRCLRSQARKVSGRRKGPRLLRGQKNESRFGNTDVLSDG